MSGIGGTLAPHAPSATLFDEVADSASALPARAGRSGDPSSDGGRLTLGRRAQSAWEGLLAAGAADCPVCAGRMELAASAGRCLECGSRLS